MMMAALLVVGLFAYFKLSIEQFPSVEFPIVVVSTEYPGATPESVESEVTRSEEHTSELQSLMRISYAVFCLKKKTNHTRTARCGTTYIAHRLTIKTNSLDSNEACPKSNN